MKLRSSDLSWQEVDGELVVLDLKSSKYLATNASGTVLVKQLTEDRSQAELAQALVEAFGISQSQATHDVLGFVTELDRSGLLERS
jgi:hypothetical protein